MGYQLQAGKWRLWFGVQKERLSALTLRVFTVGMPAPSDPPKQYMRLCTNSQRPAPVMLLNGALSSHEVPPAEQCIIIPHISAAAEYLRS